MINWPRFWVRLQIVSIGPTLGPTQTRISKPTNHKANRTEPNHDPQTYLSHRRCCYWRSLQ